MNKLNICHVDLQISDSLPAQENKIPNQEMFGDWINKSLLQQNKKNISKAEISIRIVDEKESAEYNQQYRQKDTSTNVLSFPADLHDCVANSLLGDLLICAPVVEQEAELQQKSSEAHWAHMVIHGTLHLLGYDHIESKDASTMEALEINILSLFEFSDPYRTH